MPTTQYVSIRKFNKLSYRVNRDSHLIYLEKQEYREYLKYGLLSLTHLTDAYDNYTILKDDTGLDKILKVILSLLQDINKVQSFELMDSDKPIILDLSQKIRKINNPEVDELLSKILLKINYK